MMTYSVRVSMLISLALLLMAQAMFLPIPLSITFFVMLVCLFFRRKQSVGALKRSWTLLLTFIALLSIYFSYRSFIGVEAGVAVLSTFLFAKAMESKDQRDMLILFNFALFVSASSFLFSQSFAMAVIVTLCLLSCFMGLYRLQTSQFEIESRKVWSSVKSDAGHVGKLLLYGIPFFILLFLFFPRLPPLWHIPIPDDTSVTGISDSMSPGDIAKLSQSSELAFRILGDMQKLPPRAELYWRAMVLDEYDGNRWTSSHFNQRTLDSGQLNKVQERSVWPYSYLAADARVHWVMGLEQSVPQSGHYLLGIDGRITPRRMTMKVEPIALKWLGDTQLMQLDDRQQMWQSKINTKVHSELDPKAQKLAVQLWQKSGAEPERYIQHVLQWYKQQNFAYTLSPGTLGHNRVDDFIFGSRKGFCEHFASSFAMLMRYANVPARIVVGYQGGQAAPDGESWEVRQLDAHAWTEVWLHGKWQRIDPTAMIAPQRIDSGMQDYIAAESRTLGESSGFDHRKFALLTKMRIWSDYASYQWQSRVVGYNAESQRNWLTKLGLHSSYAGALVLVIGILSLAFIYFVWMYWQRLRAVSVWERSIQHFNRKLDSKLKQMPAETFSAWMKRLANLVDEHHQDSFIQLSQIYDRQMYAEFSDSEQDILQFKALIKSCANILENV